jgi:hypothetical protein
MKQIATRDPERLVFRDDWGWLWRSVGWFIAAFGTLYTIGILLPKKPASSASTQPAALAAATQAADVKEPREKPGWFLAVMIFGLAGWCFYRRWIVLDRREGIICIRCGVGPLAWTRRNRIVDFTQIVVSRREGRDRGRRVYYSILAYGKGRSLTIATLDCDELFDSPQGARGFSRLVAEFCGYKRVEDASMNR